MKKPYFSSKNRLIVNLSKWALAHFFLGEERMLNRGLDKLELLRIVEAVANEKSIDKEVVIGSMAVSYTHLTLPTIAIV